MIKKSVHDEPRHNLDVKALLQYCASTLWRKCQIYWKAIVQIASAEFSYQALKALWLESRVSLLHEKFYVEQIKVS